MNLSELCIRRPVMAVLLSASAVLAGIIAYGDIPNAALPSYDTPTISVTATLPGASPETMASSVATQLERQFSIISSLSVISSTSTPVSYTHLRAHETVLDLVCRLLL